MIPFSMTALAGHEGEGMENIVCQVTSGKACHIPDSKGDASPVYEENQNSQIT